MQKAVIILLKGYQYFASPLFGMSCRFYPSCSAYAIEAVETHGILRGLCLAARRIFVLPSLAPRRVDPVPGKNTDNQCEHA